MTTPRIEEINYETRNYDGIKWIRYDHYEHALTEAHQAGIDEAMSAMLDVYPGKLIATEPEDDYQRGWNGALDQYKENIEALQDNK